jgi:co-chaperonin GroES (HSP10)
MFINVYNRHVLVELVEEEEEEQQSLIALPQDYKKTESPYTVVKVLQISDDCKLFLEQGDLIVIERRMLTEIEIKGEKNYLVLENYIYGRLDDETY